MISESIQMELRAKFNPDGSELRNLQLRMLRMLIYFDDFCKKHGIKYWLSAGTCLGAVRHGGFIPWDDDLDVEMLREDYEKLIAIKNEYENIQNVIQDYSSDKEYITPYGKLRDKCSELKEIHPRDKYFKYKGAFIDLFARERGSYITARLSHIIQYGSYAVTNITNTRIRRILKRTLYFGMHKCIFPMLHLYDNIFGKQDLYYPTLGCGFYTVMKPDWLFPLKEITFEGHTFPIPANVDSYLRCIYGDYWHLPEDMEHLRIHFTKINLY